MSLGYVHRDLAPDELEDFRWCSDVLHQAADVLQEGDDVLPSAVRDPLAELIRAAAEAAVDERPDTRAVAVAIAILGEDNLP